MVPSRQKTVTGSMVNTPFGPYQVQVVFTNTTIADVQLITEPGDRHSQRIAASAAPILRQEALQAQNARHRHRVWRHHHQPRLRTVTPSRSGRHRTLSHR